MGNQQGQPPSAPTSKREPAEDLAKPGEDPPPPPAEAKVEPVDQDAVMQDAQSPAPAASTAGEEKAEPEPVSAGGS